MTIKEFIEKYCADVTYFEITFLNDLRQEEMMLIHKGQKEALNFLKDYYIEDREIANVDVTTYGHDSYLCIELHSF